jgi:signal transduction histidine kinase/ActR/RegA family two-component response regulator
MAALPFSGGGEREAVRVNRLVRFVNHARPHAFDRIRNMASDGIAENPLGRLANLCGPEVDPFEAEPAPGQQPRYRQAFLSTVIAGRSDRRLAWGVLAVSALGFAAAIPYAKVPLIRIDAFIPAYEAALVVIDAVTALMLFGQFRSSRSLALLMLAAGYLYDALLAVAHALSFPGSFSPGGLLGAGPQTTAWLYMFWHGGFPLFIIGYACLNGRDRRYGRPEKHVISAAVITLAIIAAVALAVGLTALAIHAHQLLPTIMAGNSDQPMLHIVVSCIAMLAIAAIVVLWRQHRYTVLDLWLIVVACAWLFDIGLSAVFDAARFDLGFYAGRGYGLLAASFVLGVLLTETGGLHSRLAAAKALVDDYAHTLEDRVRERTAELALANETLIAETAERQKAEAHFHQAQKMEALGQLTGGMAHDFNNHLGIIIGNLDVLGDQATLAPDQKELIGEALAAALSGAELTRRLLAFARRQPLRPERIDANQLVGDITKLLRRTLGERIEIRLLLDATIPPALADPAQLQTAIANLANNARDAMPEGGRLTITTGVRHLDEDYAAEHAEVSPGGYVMIEVCDTGSGMPPETLARVFEPFFTTKDPGKGTGLGLAMVFGFLKQSGGHINAYSELGHGTTFRLYLRPDETVIEVAQPIGASEPDRGDGERILVVEDNPQLRRVLVRQLGELGYRVSETENADDALDALDGGADFDLLLTDVVMPGKLDGIALAHAFVERRPDGKVILTSGFPGTRFDSEGFGNSLRLLGKPYRKRDLARLLRETLAEATTPAGASLTNC